MTFPTAEDKTPIDRMIELFDSYDWGLLPLKDDKDNWEEFESLKQQILSEHEIVERLKAEIKSLEVLLENGEHILKMMKETHRSIESIANEALTCNRIKNEIKFLKSILENK